MEFSLFNILIAQKYYTIIIGLKFSYKFDRISDIEWELVYTCTLLFVYLKSVLKIYFMYVVAPVETNIHLYVCRKVKIISPLCL